MVAATQSRLILASASPRRLELLAQIGIIPAQVVPADLDETPRKGESPEAYVLRIACEKARAVAAKHTGDVILAADTIVVCGRRILPKAESEAQARDCLKRLTGRRHCVHTAIAVIDSKGTLASDRVTTRVRFKSLHAREIEAYVASGEWQGKAGGYAIQGRAASFIPWINGSCANVIGLPLVEAANLLQRAGIRG